MSGQVYPTLFSPIDVGGCRLRNRIAHASIWTKFVRDSRVTPELLNYLGARARGGAGLIVSEPLGMTSFTREASRLRVWDNRELDGLKRLAGAVESHGCRLLGQVQDSGRGRHGLGRNENAVGASALPDDLSWTVPRELSATEIRQMIDEWAAAALRLRSAGFSGVEISAGHGHLFHQFLSPWSNRRDDEFGGDLDGRTRFVTELIAAIRNACGRPFVIGLKLPGGDGIAGSIDTAEASAIAGRLSATKDVDYWTWAWGAHANTLWQHLPDAFGRRHPYLKRIRALRAADPEIPTGALGFLTDPNECERALVDGTSDLVFLGRPLITDPAFPNKAHAGREATIRYCVSCNTCWRTIVEAGQLECDNNPRIGEANEELWQLPQTKRPRSIVVVGGGIAGLEAAQTAARRGHRVTLFSAGAELGANTRLHAALPGGENLSSIYDFQYLAGKAAGVRFELGTPATVDDVLSLSPDQVWLATGAVLSVPSFVPAELAEAGFLPDARAMARDLLGRRARQTGRALLYDRDHTEMTYAVALLLADRFEQVTIVTPRERIAGDVSLINRQGIYSRLSKKRVDIVTNADIPSLESLDNGVIELRDVWGGQNREICGVVAMTYATARVPRLDMLRPLQIRGIPVETIGDARAPRGVLAATREGYAAGSAL